MNDNNINSLSFENIFDEYKSFLYDEFKEIYEKIFSNKNEFQSSIQIQQFIENTIKSLKDSKKEQFMLYLMNLITEFSQSTKTNEPSFVKKFNSDIKHFNKKYDKDGKLSMILKNYFFQNQNIVVYPKINSFFPHYLGISYESTLMRTLLFDIRSIIIGSQKSFKQSLNSLKTEFQRNIENYKCFHSSSVQYQQKITNLQRSYENFRLKIEGDLLKISEIINQIDDENDPQKLQISFLETRKHIDFLINYVKDSINVTNDTNLFLTKNMIQENDKVQLTAELKEKNMIIMDLKNQINNLKAELLKTALDNSRLIQNTQINEAKETDIQKTHMILFSKESQTETLIDNTENYMRTIDYLQQKNNNKKKLIYELKLQLQQQTEKFDALCDKVKHLQKKVDKASSVSANTNSSFGPFESVVHAKGSLLLEEINEKTNSLIASENKVKALERENRRLINQIEMMKENISISSKQVSKLKSDIQNLQNSSFVDLDNMAKELSEKQLVIREQNDRIAEFEGLSRKYEKYKDFKKNMITEKRYNETLRNYELIENKYEHLSEKYKNLKTFMKNHQQDISSKLDSHAKQNQLYQEQIQQLQHLVAKKEKDTIRLVKRLNKIQEASALNSNKNDVSIQFHNQFVDQLYTILRSKYHNNPNITEAILINELKQIIETAIQILARKIIQKESKLFDDNFINKTIDKMIKSDENQIIKKRHDIYSISDYYQLLILNISTLLIQYGDRINSTNETIRTNLSSSSKPSDTLIEDDQSELSEEVRYYFTDDESVISSFVNKNY